MGDDYQPITNHQSSRTHHSNDLQFNRPSLITHHGFSTRLLRWLRTGWGLPVLFVAVYAAAFLIPFPLLAWYDIPKTSFASIAQRSGLAAVGLALAGLVLILLYRQIWIVARGKSDRFTAGLVLAGWLGASAVLLMTFPGQSSDLGDYTFHGHMLVHLNANPLTTPPSAIVAREDYSYIGWYKDVDPYGPLWQWLGAGVHSLAGESYLGNLLAFKVLAILAIGITGGLVYAIVWRITPQHALSAAALWLWNPLVLNEGALHGHNDLVVMTVILAGLWLALRGAGALGLVAIIAAGMFKINAWILLPVVGLWLIRQNGWRSALISIGVAAITGAVLVWLVYLPFGGWALLPDMVQDRSWWPTGTWTASVFFMLRDTFHWPHKWVVRWVAGGGSLLFMEVAAILMLRIHNLRLGAWAVVLAYLLIGAPWFQPWYATWLVALAAIVFREKVVSYTRIFSFFMLLHPIVAQFIAAPLRLPPGGYDAVMAAAVLLVPQAMALRLMLRSMRFRKA